MTTVCRRCGGAIKKNVNWSHERGEPNLEYAHVDHRQQADHDAVWKDSARVRLKMTVHDDTKFIRDAVVVLGDDEQEDGYTTSFDLVLSDGTRIAEINAFYNKERGWANVDVIRMTDKGTYRSITFGKNGADVFTTDPPGHMVSVEGPVSIVCAEYRGLNE